jgi:competence protein ComGC
MHKLMNEYTFVIVVSSLLLLIFGPRINIQKNKKIQNTIKNKNLEK